MRVNGHNTNHVEYFAEYIERFRAFLIERGAAVAEPTNPLEVFRFHTARGLSVIYKKASGTLTWTGESLEAFRAFQHPGQSWTAGFRKTRRPKQRFESYLRRRDGDDCWYCGLPMADDEVSTEHFVAAGHGGPSHPANLALCHPTCNQRAANLSVVEKVKLREEMRAKESTMRPVCVPCEIEMRCVKNGARVLTMIHMPPPDPPDEYQMHCGDMYACPNCGARVIADIGTAVVDGHADPKLMAAYKEREPFTRCFERLSDREAAQKA